MIGQKTYLDVSLYICSFPTCLRDPLFAFDDGTNCGPVLRSILTDRSGGAHWGALLAHNLNRMEAFYAQASVTIWCLPMFFRFVWWATAIIHLAHSIAPVIGMEAERKSFGTQACAEFSSSPPGTGWSFADCMQVWSTWATTLREKEYQRYNHREIFNDTAAELRRRGSPCLVGSERYADGAGSSTIRYLATWMFAEELGCDWALPQLAGNRTDNDGIRLYCHSTVPEVNHDVRIGNLAAYPAHTPCSLTNWLQYFRYSDHAADLHDIAKAKIVRVRE